MLNIEKFYVSFIEKVVNENSDNQSFKKNLRSHNSQ